LPLDEMLPAVGQGALALECREDDGPTRALVAAIADPAAEAAIVAERAFLAAIGGDCNSSLAAHAVVTEDRVVLRVLVTDAEGRERVTDSGTAPTGAAAALGRELAARLLDAGAARLLGR
jgi:hydroxymethylbilane synthase